MRFLLCIGLVLSAALVTLAADLHDKEQANSALPCAAAADAFFENEVWAKVGARSCLERHIAGGDAGDSDFVLLDQSEAWGRRLRQTSFGTTASSSRRWRG